MGAGAGSVNFWASRKTAQAAWSLIAADTVVGGVTGGSSGASFWDAGTLSHAPLRRARRQAALAARGAARLAESVAASLRRPESRSACSIRCNWLTPVRLQYGVVSPWTDDQQIIWGDVIYDPQGQQIIWGDSRTTDDNQIIWGDSVLTSPDPK